MSLSHIGVNSLLATNQWIGLINSNLQSASRTGYKTSRISFADGLGVNSVSNQLTLPPSTLSVQATTIEWGQGSIVNSTDQTHFAIQGEGFFVLHNPNSGKYYLSRDGEFHWTQDGYLVNSAGLRVISSGQDYVRLGKGDASDIFSPDGYSRELLRHGDKSILLLDVLNRDNLRMSQYGSTVFELDGDLTTRVKNDFSATADGITFVYDDPIMIPIVKDPGFVYTPPPGVIGTDFSIDFGDNGIFDFNAFNPLGIGVDFDPNAFGNSIQDVVTAINNFGGGNVRASFNVQTDQLIIENEVPTGGDNSVIFTGVNGHAIRSFFRIASDTGLIDEVATAATETNIVQSQGDIDNSSLNSTKDIGYPGFAAPAHPAIPLTTPVFDLVNPVPTYSHAKNGSSSFLQASSLSGGASMIIGESVVTSKFDIVMELKITNEPGGLMVFAFGQNDARSLNSGGFELVYNPTAAPINLDSSVPPFVLGSGQVVLRQKPGNYDETANSPVVIGSAQNMPVIGVAAAGLAASPTHRVALRLDANQNLTFSIGGANANFALGGAGQEISGHMTLRNSQNTLQLHSLYADYKRSSNAVTVGEMVPVNIVMTATVDQGEYVNRPRSRIVQAALETSNASLTEYVPMLSLAQKLFSAISKIISTHNNMTDDLNGLLR
ncbi:MAG: hypothetical protein CVV27_12145 [Candidatus Melainabacteria bacterium HGW-Melainabacteria-1]|nr:MAG: hypothetical protein CVV27_12145 [Candidatus Melainabacteria bacterium HGW-Melainabacteria-1]